MFLVRSHVRGRQFNDGDEIRRLSEASIPMNDHRSEPNVLDRRTFLLGAALAGAAVSCGGGSTGSGTGYSGDSNESSTGRAVADDYAGDSSKLAEDTFSVIQRFPSDVLVPGDVRLPFSLSSENAQFVVDGPLTLGAQIVDLDGNAVGSRIEAVRRDVTPSPYYAFRARVDTPGIYGIMIDGGPATGANFQVSDPTDVSVPQPGQTLAGFETPTVGEPAGVDPVCTREPLCEFHAVTLTEALTSAKPVVYLVGTPAFCQTGSCAPALEALIDVAPDFGDRLTVVHAEVYTDLTATDIAPAVLALDMRFEPALFIVSADGVVVERLDGLWDVTELRERLEAAIA
jgi:hypothetical protein